jgi:hypothetical protein
LRKIILGREYTAFNNMLGKPSCQSGMRTLNTADTVLVLSAKPQSHHDVRSVTPTSYKAVTEIDVTVVPSMEEHTDDAIQESSNEFATMWDMGRMFGVMRSYYGCEAAVYFEGRPDVAELLGVTCLHAVTEAECRLVTEYYLALLDQQKEI